MPLREWGGGDEVILEGPDGVFGRVMMMVTGWYKLVVNFFLLHEFLEDFGAFVVKSLKEGWVEDRLGGAACVLSCMLQG